MERYAVEGNKVRQGIVELWDAMDRQLERPVTIQILTEEAARDPDLCATFQKHQQTASSIHNSVVLAIYDIGDWEGRPFSVMQKCDGASPNDIHRPGYPPDVPLVLAAVRQVAEGLLGCRDAGLEDWALSPQTVQIDSEGNAHFPIIEGPPPADNRESGTVDVAALNKLLRLMLVGRPEGNSDDLRWALVPGAVISLLERLDAGQAGGIATAGELANEITAIEAASMQPTQAYDPGTVVAEAEIAQGGASVTPAVLPHPSEAPTMVAPVLTVDSADDGIGQTALLDSAASLGAGIVASPVEAYTPPVAGIRATTPIRRPLPRVSSRMLPLVGVLLLVVMAFVLVKLVSSAGRADGQSLKGASTASTATTSAKQLAVVPDLRGKDLEEAQSIAGTAGLNMGAPTSLYDSTYEAGQIAEQQPAPGEQVQAGSYVTVSLSLGPLPVVNQPPSDNPPPQPPPKGKHKGKDK